MAQPACEASAITLRCGHTAMQQHCRPATQQSQALATQPGGVEQQGAEQCAAARATGQHRLGPVQSSQPVRQQQQACSALSGQHAVDPYAVSIRNQQGANQHGPAFEVGLHRQHRMPLHTSFAYLVGFPASLYRSAGQEHLLSPTRDHLRWRLRAPVVHPHSHSMSYHVISCHAKLKASRVVVIVHSIDCCIPGYAAFLALLHAAQS